MAAHTNKASLKRSFPCSNTRLQAICPMDRTLMSAPRERSTPQDRIDTIKSHGLVARISTASDAAIIATARPGTDGAMRVAHAVANAATKPLSPAAPPPKTPSEVTPAQTPAVVYKNFRVACKGTLSPPSFARPAPHPTASSTAQRLINTRVHSPRTPLSDRLHGDHRNRRVTSEPTGSCRHLVVVVATLVAIADHAMSWSPSALLSLLSTA